MTIQYAILNPLTGVYSFVSTEQERTEKIAQQAWDFYLVHVQSAPYSVVETNEDGSKTWRNPQGDEIDDQVELRAQLQSLIDETPL
jgi:hypothetical protein